MSLFNKTVKDVVKDITTMITDLNDISKEGWHDKARFEAKAQHAAREATRADVIRGRLEALIAD